MRRMVRMFCADRAVRRPSAASRGKGNWCESELLVWKDLARIAAEASPKSVDSH
jgi:hypothetical protein